MKKMLALIVIVFSIILLTGCEKQKIETLSENMKKINLSSNMVTYKAYYHNVIEYEKPGAGLKKERMLFAEYTGTIKLGIDLSKVKIDVSGNKINVFIPKATIIDEPDVDINDFKKENFIESKDGLFKNKIDGNDSTKAFKQAQEEMKKNAAGDSNLLDLAQKRAKVLIEQKIEIFSGLSKKDYTINWDFEK